MTDRTDVREFLRQMADEVPLSPVEPRPAVRRAKRRLVRTLGAATLVVAAIAAGSAVGIGRLTAAPPPVPVHPGPSVLPAYHHNGDIAVYGIVGGTPAIVAVDRATGHPRALAITGAEKSDWEQNATMLAWSPDGTQLAYTVRDEVRILDVASGTSRKIATGGVHGTDLAWSPDGTTIAMAPGGASLRLVGTDGHLQATLNPKLGSPIAAPTWSPDGSRIAFIANNQSGADSTSLFVMNSDGSDVRLLVASGLFWWAASPAWSPDGRKIAYLSEEPVKHGPTGLVEIIVSMIDSNGSNPVQVLRAGTCFCISFSPGLTWSPDGTKLAVVTEGDHGALSTFNPDGTGLRLIAEIGWGRPAWRPVP
jgi:Tol biopolymer transport system component